MKFIIGIYNQNGELVRTLHDEDVEPGNFLLEWDGKTNAGRKAPSGSYVLRVDIPGKRTVARFKIMIE